MTLSSVSVQLDRRTRLVQGERSRRPPGLRAEGRGASERTAQAFVEGLRPALPVIPTEAHSADEGSAFSVLLRFDAASGVFGSAAACLS